MFSVTSRDQPWAGVEGDDPDHVLILAIEHVLDQRLGQTPRGWFRAELDHGGQKKPDNFNRPLKYSRQELVGLRTIAVPPRGWSRCLETDLPMPSQRKSCSGCIRGKTKLTCVNAMQHALKIHAAREKAMQHSYLTGMDELCSLHAAVNDELARRTRLEKAKLEARLRKSRVRTRRQPARARSISKGSCQIS
jgi:hypothetical protein